MGLRCCGNTLSSTSSHCQSKGQRVKNAVSVHASAGQILVRKPQVSVSREEMKPLLNYRPWNVAPVRSAKGYF